MTTMINYDLTKIKGLVFDVDGVLSRETITMYPGGEPMRTVNIKDGYALQLAVKAGYHVAIITGARTEAVKVRYNGLGITDVYLGAAIKKDCFEELMTMYDMKPEEILYMGDDIPDLEVLRYVGIPVAPADACAEVLEEVIYVSEHNGGEGAVRDIIEQVLRVKGIWALDSKGVISDK